MIMKVVSNIPYLRDFLCYVSLAATPLNVLLDIDKIYKSAAQTRCWLSLIMTSAQCHWSIHNVYTHRTSICWATIRHALLNSQMEPIHVSPRYRNCSAQQWLWYLEMWNTIDKMNPELTFLRNRKLIWSFTSYQYEDCVIHL